MKIKKGDLVVVISGKDRGKRGKVMEVYPKTQKLLVEKLNLMHKHQKATRQGGNSGIVEKEAPLHVSKVMLVCPKTDKGTRVRKMQLAEGKRVRISVKSGEMIDKA